MKLIKVLWLFMLPFAVTAQTIWVSDEIQAPLRKSPNSRAEIIGFVDAGQSAQKLAEKTDDEGTVYTQVKLQDGRKGWLTNYYVMTKQSVHEQLAPLQTELSAAKTQMVELQQQLQNQATEMQNTINEQAARIQSLESGVNVAESKLADAADTRDALSDLQSVSANQTSEITKLKAALAQANKRAEKERLRYASLAKVSKDAARIDNQNQMLQKKAIELEQNLQLVESQNETLRSRGNRNEWFVGAVITIVGILMGLVLPIFFRRRNRYR